MDIQEPKVNPNRYLSFFSGALGLDLGLEEAGLLPLAVNEIDPVACETIRLNRPSLRLFSGDIRDISATSLKKAVGLKTDELFAIVGGPPCQAFSTAGKRLGLNDDRGNVFLHFINLITELRPRYAVFENVRGLLSAPLLHRPHNQRGRDFPPLSAAELPGGALLKILDTLEANGYATTFTLYNMANFGVPQVRERLIFFAARSGTGVPHMQATHAEGGENGVLPWRTVREAIGDLNASGDCMKFPKHRMRFFSLLKEGQNWRNLPQSLWEEAMGPSLAAAGGKTGFYRRLSWNKPAPTLVTRPNMPATSLCHPTELRPLSVREYARIQSFPDSYKFAGKLEDQYRQIGNAVPPIFGRQIGRHLIDFDEDRLIDSRANFRLSRYVATDHESWRRSVSDNQSRLF